MKKLKRKNKSNKPKINANIAYREGFNQNHFDEVEDESFRLMLVERTEAFYDEDNITDRSKRLEAGRLARKMRGL